MRDQVSGKNNKIDLNVSISGRLLAYGALWIVSSAILDITGIHRAINKRRNIRHTLHQGPLPVVELGLLNETAHKANENVKIDDINYY